MFDGFNEERVTLANAEIALVRGGDGPPLLLLHGYPQTHVTWHKIAPLLAEHFTVIAPDLPGYGDSTGPAPDEKHQSYSKRTTAATMVELMGKLGYSRFGLAGHDRGGRVAYRLALDHPAQVSRLAVIDIIPTLEMWEAMDHDLAYSEYHWLFLSQPAPLPETLIGAAPDFYLDWTIQSWMGEGESIDTLAMAEYRRCFRKPSVIRAACEDYRAGMWVDIEHDRADRDAGHKIQCPLLALWHEEGQGEAYLDVWRRWAVDARGFPVVSGHFMMEQAPAVVAPALAQFFRA